MGLVGFAFRPHLNANYFPVAIDMQMMARRRFRGVELAKEAVEARDEPARGRQSGRSWSC
jgi:hypothetical protein